MRVIENSVCHSDCIICQNICFQLQYRYRGCNKAECGGSTSICTSTGSTYRTCREGGEFDNLSLNNPFRLNLMRIFLNKYIGLCINITLDNYSWTLPTILSQLWTLLGKVGAPGAVAAKHVEEGWDLLFCCTLIRLSFFFSKSWYPIQVLFVFLLQSWPNKNL